LSTHTLPPEVLREALLAGGDVYELCFTAAPAQRAQLETIGQTLGVALTCIGTIRKESGLVVYDQAGMAIPELPGGFDHFRP
jgi:thiamine-monophosphate kinase